MVHGPLAGVVYRSLRAGSPGYGYVHCCHQLALNGALRHTAGADRAHVLAGCIRHCSRRRNLCPGDAPPHELRQPGGCDLRSCLLDLLSVPSACTGRSLRRAWHLGDLARIPGKLAIWGSALPAAALGQSTTKQVQALVDSLQALAYRMQDLIETRAKEQSQVLARELLSQLREWRLGLQRIFGNLSRHPEAADFADFRARLDAMLEQLEGQIEKAVAVADKAGISIPENENSIRLLGSFRGLSEELVNFAKQSGEIDWVRLREARF